MRTDQIKVGACFLSTIDFAFAVPTSLLGPGRCWHVHAQPGERVSFQQHPSPRETLEPDDCVHVKVLVDEVIVFGVSSRVCAYPYNHPFIQGFKKYSR